MNSAPNADVGQRPGFATLSQFRELVSAFRRRMGWHLLLLSAGFLALMAVGFALADMVNRADVPTDSPLRLVLMACIFGPCFIGVMLFDWAGKRWSPKCPHCLDAIDLGVASYHIIVTRRCPKCSQPLFEDEPPIPPEAAGLGTPPLLSRSELTTAQELADRSYPLLMFLWLIPGMLLMVAGSLMDKWVQELLASRLSEIWLPFVRPVLWIPGLVVCGCALIAYERRYGALRRHGHCPHCASDISAHSVASLTGNCETCGQPAVGDPVPGMQPPLPSQNVPRWTVAEFRQLAKYRWDRLWIGCFIGGGFAAILLIPVCIWCSSQDDAEVSLAGALLFLGLTIGLGIAQLGGVWWWHRYSARGLHCPECEHELIHWYRLVVSSHRCYDCGSTVLRQERSLER